MIPRPFAEIAGLGVAVPDRIVTNADFEKTLDTSDQWIVERTGIRERRIAGPGQSLASLAQQASELAMQRAGITAGDLDAIVLGTATPDRLLPSTACDLQALLGADKAAAFDISAACPGFIYATTVAEAAPSCRNAMSPTSSPGPNVPKMRAPTPATWTLTSPSRTM